MFKGAPSQLPGYKLHKQRTLIDTLKVQEKEEALGKVLASQIISLCKLEGMQ